MPLILRVGPRQREQRRYRFVLHFSTWGRSLSCVHGRRYTRANISVSTQTDPSDAQPRAVRRSWGAALSGAHQRAPFLVGIVRAQLFTRARNRGTVCSPWWREETNSESLSVLQAENYLYGVPPYELQSVIRLRWIAFFSKAERALGEMENQHTLESCQHSVFQSVWITGLSLLRIGLSFVTRGCMWLHHGRPIGGSRLLEEGCGSPAFCVPCP